MATRTLEQRQQATTRLIQFFLEEAKDEQVNEAGIMLEAIARLEPALVGDESLEALAAHRNFSVRMCAASILWDKALTAPASVSLPLLGTLAQPSSEDWYVYSPAMATVKQLMLHRPAARVILDRLASSAETDDRIAAAEALLEIAKVDKLAAPPDLIDKLIADENNSVATTSRRVLEITGKVDPDKYRSHFCQFWL
jgi:hypothetical protein